MMTHILYVTTYQPAMAFEIQRAIKTLALDNDTVSCVMNDTGYTIIFTEHSPFTLLALLHLTRLITPYIHTLAVDLCYNDAPSATYQDRQLRLLYELGSWVAVINGEKREGMSLKEVLAFNQQ